MKLSREFQQAFAAADKLRQAGRFMEAETAYRQLLECGDNREIVLRALVELYLQSRRTDAAMDTLLALTEEVPDELYYYARLAAMLEGMGRLDAAIAHYQRLLQRQPGLAAAYFNIALLYKKTRCFDAALQAYEKAIECGIDNIQEVYSNMGVLYSEMRQAEKAGDMFTRALAIEPAYVPALFNLAGLFEESGKRQQAIELYERILAINPRHWDALSRLADATKVTSADSHLPGALQQATADAESDPLAREGLYFALGKVLDDLGRYEEAFSAYRAANDLGRLRNPDYDSALVEQAFNELIEIFNVDWLHNSVSTSTATPIFICGMFRSGSTLVEQVLAGHPSMTAGGELDYLPWLAAEKLAPYPRHLTSVPREELATLGEDYLSRLRLQFPEAIHISDKRPDNFLHIGLIKLLFPAARIIYTRRSPVDNCLSVYFQQLGGNLAYATDLQATAHYYTQHTHLMAHWLNCFAGEIFTLDYDEFVRSPEPVLRRMLDYLGLEWDAQCLAFQHTDNQVKTASVWQVREALHTHSSGRWRHYAPFVRDIEALLI